MSFKAINWTPSEMIGERKMDATAENADWLFRNTPRAMYTLPSGLRRVEGTRLASGRAVVAARKSDQAAVTIRFDNFFSIGCEPILTTGIVTDGHPKIHCVVRGIGRLMPDHTGFQAVINVAADSKANDIIAKTMYVSWQAFGY